MKTPNYLMRDIRQRLGLDENDTSRDTEIEAMTPEKKLRAVVGWHLGDEQWANDFINWAVALGVTIEPEQE